MNDFDFRITRRQIIMEYLKLYGSDRPDDAWSLGNVLNVFQTFYEQYQRTFGRDHPKLSNRSINRVIQELTDSEYDAETHEVLLIPEYFGVDFESECDYSISHFVSGSIRELRYYESMYE